MGITVQATKRSGRIAWVDYAKGFCIILVVMMHSTLGVEAALGARNWLHEVVVFAKPFRIPAFFLMSGLLLGRFIERDWRTYLDRKVVHFAYFYVLWLTIQFGVKFPGWIGEQGIWPALYAYLEAFVQPFGALWFIYLLPIFFVVTKLTRGVPAPVIFLAAAALEIAHISTGAVVIDEFASRFVYFYAGYILARWIFAFAEETRSRPKLTMAAVVAWGIANGAVVAAGWADLPLVSLLLGFLGAAAIVSVSALLSGRDLMAPIRYCGRHSLIIYLAFVLPMAAMRVILIKFGLIADAGTLSALVTIVAVIAPLALYWLVRDTRLRFLFERPDSFRLVPNYRLAHR
jgi:uncharacterized membrane protein YcfT